MTTAHAGPTVLQILRSGEGQPATQAPFVCARAIAVDAAGNLFIADAGGHVVHRVGRDR